MARVRNQTREILDDEKQKNSVKEMHLSKTKKAKKKKLVSGTNAQ